MKNCIVYLVVIMNFWCDARRDKYDWTYAEKKWAEAEKIEAEVTGAKISGPIFNVLDYNVVPDTDLLNTDPINELISLVSDKGGGVLRFPKGVYRTGGIILKDNIEINIQEGAVLKFSQNPVDYTPNVIGHW